MVTGLEIQSRSQVLAGQAFGATGAYEKIVGTLRFAVDPTHPINRRVTDIELAPRNRDGQVEFAADFCESNGARLARSSSGAYPPESPCGCVLSPVPMYRQPSGPKVIEPA